MLFWLVSTMYKAEAPVLEALTSKSNISVSFLHHTKPDIQQANFHSEGNFSWYS